MTPIEPFLTAYDPSDLPGGSIDPLGFERGYLLLADRIWPGMTNVASRPRYFSVLCGGIFLAGDLDASHPRDQYGKRRECALRFERLWALANVLASEQSSDGELPLAGLRGVTYAQARRAELLRKSADRTDARFRLLSRQVQYGAIGIYGAVAAEARLFERRSLALTPGLGEKLGDAFVRETRTPLEVRRAVTGGDFVSLRKLTTWGELAHIATPVTDAEAECLHEVLHLNPLRSRMAAILKRHPARQQESELGRIGRLATALTKDSANADLWEGCRAITSYEKAYRIAQLGFERLIWRCRRESLVTQADLRVDPVLRNVRKLLPSATATFTSTIDSIISPEFRRELPRLDDVRRFLEEAASASKDPDEFLRILVLRHEDVQRGKFDKGRRKLPWVEIAGSGLSLTMTQVGGRTREVTDPEEIEPHPYRLQAADNLIDAAERRE